MTMGVNLWMMNFMTCGKGTASFSPWRIGTCESHNHPIITMLMILKICDDVKCSYDTALA